MLHKLVGSALVAAALLALQSQSAAQDISGTWLKATATAKVLAPTFAEPGALGSSIESKPARLNYKSTFYLRVEGADPADGELNEFVMSTWRLVDGQLQFVTDEARFLLGPNGIQSGLSIVMPVSAKTNGEVEDLGLVYLDGNGRIKAKFDKEGELKKLSFASLGILGFGDLKIDGIDREVVGSGRIKARSIPENKVPPIAED